MAQTLSKADATADWLAGRVAPAGAAWAREARARATGRLTAPGRRDEYWRYTNPATLLQRDPPAAAIEDGPEPFDGLDRLRLVFRDGVLDLGASDALAMEFVEIQTFAETTSTDIHWARELFGRLEAAGQDPVERPFAALNTAFAADGIVLRVTGRAPRPLAFVYLHEDPHSDAMIRHLIKMEPGADLTLLESGPGAARLNAVTEVDVAAGAAFHHLRVQGPDAERRSVVHLFARVAEGGAFKSFTLTANGAMTRNETVVDLAGAGAVVHVAGAGLGDRGYHHDDTVFLTHSAPDCESRQVFKSVLRNGATGVFQGKILVHRAAQRTDGYQISQGLMLDDDSQFLAKPELEIYADDVKCSHGSTVGAIDPVALFYLTSRGVPRRVAQDMLVMAFAVEALEEIEDETLREATSALLQDWLASHTSK